MKNVTCQKIREKYFPTLTLDVAVAVLKLKRVGSFYITFFKLAEVSSAHVNQWTHHLFNGKIITLDPDTTHIRILPVLTSQLL